MSTQYDAQRLEQLHEQEMNAFVAARPRSRQLLQRARGSMPNGVPVSWIRGLHDHPPLFIASGNGAYITDVDGHRYLDMNHADMSMSCGYAHPAIVRAVSEQVALGSQFLLPTELACEVSEALGARFGMPFWQYTLSASIANKECIRLARRHTGRHTVLVFSGSYHGHIEETLDAVPEAHVGSAQPDTLMLAFNDIAGLERVLARGEIACVIVELAMTNCSLVLPDPGFLDALRALTRKHGTLLVADETHTHVCAWGGLTRAWNVEPDLLVLGKSIAGGIPMGVYGMGEALCRTLESATEIDHWPEPRQGDLPLGGTLFGYPLALAAARATLTEILTPEAHARTAMLGERLADGIDALVGTRGLEWKAFRLYCRGGVCYAPQFPRNYREASAQADFRLNRYQRLFMANRGVWEAILSAGPAVSFVATEEDIDRYLDVFAQMLAALLD